MAYTGDDSDDYLPGSDDSIDQDERPNRWTGAPSTWQQLNNAEIDTLTALNEIRNQDLSIHLYNAFALKHRHGRHTKLKLRGAPKPVPDEDINTVTGQPVREDKWVPSKLWTAWPLPVRLVPRPELMKRADAADAPFRMHVPYTSKGELEEVVSATMLRLAKEKFRARQALQESNAGGPHSQPDGDGGSGVEENSRPGRARSTSRVRSKSKGQSKNDESMSEGYAMDTDGTDTEKASSSRPVLLKTVVTTDDELSYSLLRPSAQGILTKLDATLNILHIMQDSRFNCPSDSDTSSTSGRNPSRSRSRSRASSRARSGTPGQRQSLSNTIEVPAAPETVVAEVKKRGRPKKVYPRLDGETDRAYAVRIARLRKEPIPIFTDEEPEVAPEPTQAPNSANEYTDDNAMNRPSSGWKAINAPESPPQPCQRQVSPSEVSDAATTTTTTTTTTRGGDKTHRKPNTQPRMSRARLRDWRDVLGAATLAGFPAAALDRAARRCADLFGQEFVLHTLNEEYSAGSPDQKRAADKHVRYEPGMAIPPILLEDSEEDEGDGGVGVKKKKNVPQRRRAPTPRGGEGSGSRSQRRIRSISAVPRSRSQGKSTYASAGTHLCTYPNCPRAVVPFERRPNLLRHIRLVHGGGGGGTAEPEVELDVEVDSEDEMHGAVHVDGFLKPIKMRPGWRKGTTADDDDRAVATTTTTMAGEKKNRKRGGAQGGRMGR